MAIQSYNPRAKDVPLSRDFFVYELPLWRDFTLKIPKVYSAGLSCFAPWATRRLYQRRQCTVAASTAIVQGQHLLVLYVIIMNSLSIP